MLSYKIRGIVFKTQGSSARDIMNLFLSKYKNNVDKKGRVSVPVNFRTTSSAQGFSGIIAYQSIRNNCIEACGLHRLEQLSQIIENLDPYSEERDAFETIILGGAVQLPFDGEGRVVLPKELVEHAGIEKAAYFVGKGQVFEIWSESEFSTYADNAKQVAMSNKLLLKNIKKES